MGIGDLLKKISNQANNLAGTNTTADTSMSSSSSHDDEEDSCNLDVGQRFSIPNTSHENDASSPISLIQTAARNKTPALSNTKPIRRHSSSGPQTHVSIVTQAGAEQDQSPVEPKGQPITHSRTMPLRHKPQKGKTTVSYTAVTHEPVEARVEEVSPAHVFPRCKPNDVILLYRDLSELATSGLKSVISGFNIMFHDGHSLRRRALHEESELSVNGTSSSSTKIGTEKSLTRMQERNERANLVLWWRPLYTIWYFILECNALLLHYTKQLWHNKGIVLLFLVLMSILTTIYNIEGAHQKSVAALEKQLLWCGYWVVLGIMSSVGLGTGLHTFVLYLGPFIAKVTLAAYECKTLEFPEPPYPQGVECPGDDVTRDAASITLWSIMSKVRLEAMMWGAGTAIGELPPYFMARAAKLSGTEDDIDDDELEEVLEMEEKERGDPEAIKQMSFMDRTKIYMHDLVHRAGFFGILACASIPNPLFDLAGITCGHFLIPFWTFFGATLIGKAVIKMHIQQLIVIFAFSEHHVELLLRLVKSIPAVGDKIAQPFKDYLLSQRAKLHGNNSQATGETPWLAWIFEKIIIIMVAYFVISIINSFAQNYHKRLCKEKKVAYRNGKLK